VILSASESFLAHKVLAYAGSFFQTAAECLVLIRHQICTIPKFCKIVSEMKSKV